MNHEYEASRLVETHSRSRIAPSLIGLDRLRKTTYCRGMRRNQSVTVRRSRSA